MNIPLITVNNINMYMSIDGLSYTVDIPDKYHNDTTQQLELLHNGEQYKTKASYIPGYKRSIKFELPACNRKGLNKVPTSVTISLGSLNKNVNFARVESNPSALSWKGNNMCRKILITIFNEKYFNSIYCNARITLLDIAFDIINHRPEDYWYMIPKAKCGGIFFSRDGIIDTIYTGSNRSKLQLTSYEKMKQYKNTKRFSEQVPGMPDTILRLEARLRDTKYFISNANKIDNPFGKIRLFKPFKECNGITPCFFDSVRFRGLASAKKLLSSKEKKAVDKHLNDNLVTDLMSDEVWSHWQNIVDRSLYPLYPSMLFKEKRNLYNPKLKKIRKGKKSINKGITRTSSLFKQKHKV